MKLQSCHRGELDANILAASALLEWLQLFFFIVDPAFGWDVNWNGCGTGPETPVSPRARRTVPMRSDLCSFEIPCRSMRWAKRIQFQVAAADVGYNVRSQALVAPALAAGPPPERHLTDPTPAVPALSSGSAPCMPSGRSSWPSLPWEQC